MKKLGSEMLHFIAETEIIRFNQCNFICIHMLQTVLNYCRFVIEVSIVITLLFQILALIQMHAYNYIYIYIYHHYNQYIHV